MLPDTALSELLLAQMVYEKGEDFVEIASALSKHPLLKHQMGRRVGAADCRDLYEKLLVREGLERFDSSAKIPPWVNKLATILYTRYVEEIANSLQQDEQDFKRTFQELEALKKEAEQSGQSFD